VYSLYIYDLGQQNASYNQTELIDFLIKIQFMQLENNQFLPADLFMQHLTFLGCSPSLNDELTTQISTKITPFISAIGGDSISRLSCPNCKKKIEKPSSIISNFSVNQNWSSPCCKKLMPLSSINWRKSAGFSKTFIQISNIFPKEAIPTDDFLLQLCQFSLSTWSYFYSKQQIF